jgi:hypothetical protein
VEDLEGAGKGCGPVGCSAVVDRIVGRVLDVEALECRRVVQEASRSSLREGGDGSVDESREEGRRLRSEEIFQDAHLIGDRQPREMAHPAQNAMDLAAFRLCSILGAVRGHDHVQVLDVARQTRVRLDRSMDDGKGLRALWNLVEALAGLLGSREELLVAKLLAPGSAVSEVEGQSDVAPEDAAGDGLDVAAEKAEAGKQGWLVVVDEAEDLMQALVGLF